MRILFIFILFFLNACTSHTKDSRQKFENEAESEIQSIMLEEEPLGQEELDRYFADLSNRYKKVYLVKSRKEAAGKELGNGIIQGGTYQAEKSTALELLFNLSSSKIPYCFHISKDDSEEQLRDSLKKSIKKLKKIKKKDLDLSYMHAVNYYADAYLYLGDKKYLLVAEDLYEEILDRLSDREGFFLNKSNIKSVDIQSNSYAVLTIIKLYRNTLDLRYLEKASRLNDQILDAFNLDSINPELFYAQLYLYNFTGDLALLDNAKYFSRLILENPESFRTAEYARFMNFLYYFISDSAYKEFAEETLEKLIKEQIKADQKNYYSLLMLKAELSNKPLSYRAGANNRNDLKASKSFKEFLKQKTNYYVILN